MSTTTRRRPRMRLASTKLPRVVSRWWSCCLRMAVLVRRALSTRFVRPVSTPAFANQHLATYFVWTRRCLVLTKGVLVHNNVSYLMVTALKSRLVYHNDRTRKPTIPPRRPATLINRSITIVWQKAQRDGWRVLCRRLGAHCDTGSAEVSRADAVGRAGSQHPRGAGGGERSSWWVHLTTSQSDSMVVQYVDALLT
jgi:hypothetical protein